MVAANGPQASITWSPEAKKFGQFVFALVIVAFLLILLSRESPSVATGIAVGLLVTAFIVVGPTAMPQLRKALGLS